MRLIGHLKDEASARTFGDYLASMEIRNQLESDEEGWAVWIHSEDQLDTGRDALTAYLQNPGDPKYQEASRKAALLAVQERREKAKFEKRYHTRDQIWTSGGMGRVTLALIILSVIVTAVGGLPPAWQRIHWLMISETPFGFLTEVRQGQVWRLVTPIFIHSTIFHILFNMFWLRDLGSMIEMRRGAKTLLGLVLVTGITSNVGQYYYYGIAFGGMSGVIYGLFGYIWIRGQCEPSSGFHLPPMTIWVMLIWFFLCWSGLLGPIANGAHTVGLIVGMLLGATPMVKRVL